MTTLLDAPSTVNPTTRPGAAISNVVPVRSTHPAASVHDSAVAEIVGMIAAKYEEAGKRSFAIGKRAYEHALWQKGNHEALTGKAYQSGDFDNLMDQIRDGVRESVSIKPESIRVSDWVRCHVLRELVREVIADHADSLTMNEYRTIVGKALCFSSRDLEGDLNPGWLDMIRGVAHARGTGKRVTRADFEARIADTLKRVAGSLSTLSPDARAAQVASEASKAKKAAVAKANEDISGALSAGLSAGHVTAEGALSILETVAKHHGISLPSAIGFDPARCTAEDCDLLTSAMFQAGKYAEMVRLRDRLNKMVAAVDKARETSHGLSARMALKSA